MDFSVIISNEKLIQGPRKKIHISQQQSMLIDDQPSFPVHSPFSHGVKQNVLQYLFTLLYEHGHVYL